ncbi:GlcG/HbpS family heme-binding protein [Sphingomonas abietis]|uniref:Heme-binding protein n=1 Tax=Sphingomonas abietis TaxID=3012344 RepID=A0ABY7NPW0_9SPHN|nr:heme-binding protein [Sphingomonas abietis]WBO21974.1 heme-binding protein [Sphingomonas abietis]
MSLTNAKIQAALEAGLAKAAEIGCASSITILDSGRNLRGFIRMEGALLASIEISQGKAFTAASMQMNTADLTEYVQPGAPFYGLEVSHRHPMVIFGGGVVAKTGDEFVGAVGAAGGSIDDDVAVASAAVAALV